MSKPDLFIEGPEGERLELIRLTPERVKFIGSRLSRHRDRLAAALVGVALGRTVDLGEGERVDIDDVSDLWPIGTYRATKGTDEFLLNVSAGVLRDWAGPVHRRELLRAAASIEAAAGVSLSDSGHTPRPRRTNRG